MAFHFVSENDHVVGTDLSTFCLNVPGHLGRACAAIQMVLCLDTMPCKSVESGSVAADLFFRSPNLYCRVNRSPNAGPSQKCMELDVHPTHGHHMLPHGTSLRLVTGVGL